MTWPWPLGPRRVSEADATLLKRRCASRVSALKVCRAANVDPTACSAFAEDVRLCQATVVCPEVAKAFIECSTASRPSAALNEELPDCAKQAAAVTRCLRKYALPS